MSRSWKYVAAWLAVTITAITVTWLGVRLGVAPALSADPPVAIDANRRYTELRFGLEQSSAPATITPAPSPTPSATTARPTHTPARTKPPTTRPANPSASASPSRKPSPTPDRRPRYRIPADGGSITVAYSSERVDVVDADPLPGYVATATRRSATIVVVRLIGPTRTSTITAYWNAGPAAQVIED